MSILKIESYRKGIVYSTLLNLLNKVVGFVNNLIVAYFFGTQLKSDVYFYSFATLTLIASFLTNINGIVIIPEAMRIRVEDEKEGMNFINFFLLLYLILGVVTTTVLYVIPVDSFTFFSKFNRSALDSNIEILLYIIPYFFFYIFTTFLLDILTSYKYFTLPMFVSMLTNIFCIGIILALKQKIGISSIALGVSIAYFVNTVVLFYILVKHVRWRFFLNSIPITAKIFKNLTYAVLGNITTVLGSYIPLYLISGFNSGVITALNYGRNLANIPDQFITVQFSSIIGIKLNEVYSRKNLDEFNKAFLDGVKILLFFLIPISLFFFVFGREIISIVYKRGAFDSQSVDITSFFFQYFSLSLPFLALNTITARLFSAGQKIAAEFYSSIIVNVIFLCLLYFYIAGFGPKGYPFAILTYLPISVLGVNFYLCKKILPTITFGVVLRSFIETSILNLVITLPIYFLYKHTLVRFNALLIIFLCSGIYFILLFLINFLFKINKEVYIYQQQLLKKLIN